MLILSITTVIAEYGYTGMGMAAFLAGSFIPFSSEAILTGLYATGLDLWLLIAFATIGNVMGGMFNYLVGRMCNEGWVYRLFRIKEEKLQSTKDKVRQRGAWMGLLAWLPLVGTAISIALGILRVNALKSLLSMFVGKFIRYIVLGIILYFAQAGVL